MKCIPIYVLLLHTTLLLCIAHHCPPLMKPVNGKYLCNNSIVTGTTCSFQCDDGYRLLGSDQRSCLSGGKWTGSTTSCEILQCPRLDNPDNGTVILPCSTKLNTACRIRCNLGFYTTTPNPFQQCVLQPGNAVAWTAPPLCIGK